MTTLIADPAVTAIPLTDNGDPLVDLQSMGLRCASGDPVGHQVRHGLAIRLAAADAALRWAGARLLIVEGHRRPADQRRIFASYVAELRTLNPGLARSELDRLASRYVAPLHAAPHIGGAAVDLTLIDRTGAELWMGTPIDATPEESAGACLFDAPGIDAIARRNRTLLKVVLEEAGLVNYPTEWWHWSYGDRYWAYTGGHDEAIYGPIEAAA